MNEQETYQQAQASAAPSSPGLPPPLPPAAPTAAPVTIRRSPGLAVVLSCFPGLGHLYLGLYQRAFAVFISFVAAIWLSEHSSLGILVAGVVLFAFVDAYRQAQALNLGLVAEPISPAASGATPARGNRLGFGVFLLLAGLFLLYNQFYPVDFTFLEDWWPVLLVLAGVYMVLAHFRDKRRQAERGTEAGVGSSDSPRAF
ncbi:MAG: hypothetical protein B7Z68_11910 [Acidobacteria bacterium 21-70-11]|nr:MAG: hypothetical protein B7Z68_11910 [Acidobacteria bacterium 21-70-11]OYW06106.1 MAG: hypothetical protein B7Z61_03780 [Acidobacteria bacterium 37-71-11]HQT96162.1 DUF5668 domain-containing protein [Thermoanaerobaculaceae bacterium]HQU34034.1 DUF5668 domain-containing protein [Thermoanaerobaculaceae bacterium]